MKENLHFPALAQNTYPNPFSIKKMSEEISQGLKKLSTDGPSHTEPSVKKKYTPPHRKSSPAQKPPADVSNSATDSRYDT